MRSRCDRVLLVTSVIALLLAAGLPACGSAPAPTLAPTALPTQATAPTTVSTPATTLAAATSTKPAPTATSAPPTPAPAVGGKIVVSLPFSPETLYSLKANSAIASIVLGYIGAPLVTQDPDGKYVGYLAESWKISPDGLTWDFVIKKGIKFHDGSPCNANDFAWTYQQAMDPEVRSVVGQMYFQDTISAVKALDDYTLRLELVHPFYGLLLSLIDGGRLQPLSRAAVEKAGDQVASQPVGVGPYRFKDWQTGERITLERNPDFSWGPSFARQGPYYLQTVQFAFISEYATTLAGLEAGEIDYANLETKDVARVRDLGKFQVLESYQQGVSPFITMNLTKPPFDDIRVRKALNLAVDRQTMIKTIYLGNAVEQRGPISLAVAGYSPDVEKIGYGFDLAQAKALMAEAGYVAGPSGILEKAGKALKLNLLTLQKEEWVKAAEILREQFKALGVDVQIQQVDQGVQLSKIYSGDYEFSMAGMTYEDADLMYLMFHSSMIKTLNMSWLNDPEMDKMLEATRRATDAGKWKEAVTAAQTYIVQNAFIVPICTPKNFRALAKRIGGAVFSPVTAQLYLDKAYVQVK